jgi:hypothetical protein
MPPVTDASPSWDVDALDVAGLTAARRSPTAAVRAPQLDGPWGSGPASTGMREIATQPAQDEGGQPSLAISFRPLAISFRLRD